MRQDPLLQRIRVNPGIFGGKPIFRGRRLAVETVLGMLAAGDTADTLLRLSLAGAGGHPRLPGLCPSAGPA